MDAQSMRAVLAEVLTPRAFGYWLDHGAKERLADQVFYAHHWLCAYLGLTIPLENVAMAGTRTGLYFEAPTEDDAKEMIDVGPFCYTYIFAGGERTHTRESACDVLAQTTCLLGDRVDYAPLASYLLYKIVLQVVQTQGFGTQSY